MANLYNSSQGLIMNQSNISAHTRVYSCAKTTPGTYLRFTISGGNPNMTIFTRTILSFTQTNYPSQDFHQISCRYSTAYFDTSGNGSLVQTSHIMGNVEISWNFSNRQGDMWVFQNNSTSFPGKASIMTHVSCNRWDYLSISQL